MKSMKIIGILSLFLVGGVCKAASRVPSRWRALTRPASSGAVGSQFGGYTATSLRPAGAAGSTRFSSTTPEGSELLTPEWLARREDRMQAERARLQGTGYFSPAKMRQREKEREGEMQEWNDFWSAYNRETSLASEGIFNRMVRLARGKPMFADPEKQKRYEAYKAEQLEDDEFRKRIKRWALMRNRPWSDPEKEQRYQDYEKAQKQKNEFGEFRKRFEFEKSLEGLKNATGWSQDFNPLRSGEMGSWDPEKEARYKDYKATRQRWKAEGIAEAKEDEEVRKELGEEKSGLTEQEMLRAKQWLGGNRNYRTEQEQQFLKKWFGPK